jgi:adenylate cyclase
VLDTSGARIPLISRNPPTATSPNPPWTGTNGGSSAMASSVFGSFFNDSNEDVAQLSPGFRPSSGNENIIFSRDDRRPSVASATTVSSTGSKSSFSRGGGFLKKNLQGFFGDEFPGDSRQNSDTSLATPFAVDNQSLRGARNRTNSVNNTLGSSINSRPGSPIGSRPRTPQPSSEVTPWEFQEYNEVSSIGLG